MQIIYGVAAEAKSTFVMADDGELRRLREMVVTSYPQFGSRVPTTSETHLAFRNAFVALGHIGRTSEIVTRDARSIGWWAGHCEEFLQQSGYDNYDVGSAPFLMAVIAHGDIPHSPPARFPHDQFFGLTIGTGIRATDKWRGVLETGEVLPPVPLTRPTQNYPAPDFQVRW